MSDFGPNQQERRPFLIGEAYWPGLGADHRARSQAAWNAFFQGRYGEAADQFRAAYNLILENQPEGHRFHKGESLHNLGLALMWAGRTDDARVETLAAFVEDAASLAEEEPVPLELDRPAAHNLVFVFGLPGPWLAALGSDIRRQVQGGVLIPDPHPLVARLVTPTPPPPLLRVPGEFHAPPERRVFIGGWYGRINATLRPLRDHLDSLGYDGVIAGDFATPGGWGQDEVAKGLLGLCHYGVFDVTESAGQIEEIAFTQDTMRNSDRMIGVFDLRVGSQPHISTGMTLEKLGRWNVPYRGYDDVPALNALVEAWLRR